MKWIVYTCLGWIWLGIAFPAQAQDKVFTLNSCIRQAQSNSPEARIARQGYESVYWSYKAYRAGLLPQARLQLNTPGLNRAITSQILDNGEQSFVFQNFGISSAGLVISQQIAPTGGTLIFRSDLQRNDVFGTNGSFQYSATPFVFFLNQPLFAYNDLKWEKRSQPLQFERAERAYLEALEDIAVDICGKYFDVYIAQLQLENAILNEQVNDSIYQISRGRYSVGKIAENDLLQTELAYLNSRAQVQDVMLALDQAQTDLAITLGIDEMTQFSVVEPDTLRRSEIDIEFAIQHALEKRSSAIDFEIQQLEAERSIARAKSDARLGASINASFGYNQSGETLSDAYFQPQQRQTASLSLDIPILQWGRGRARVESAMVDQERTVESIRLEKQRLQRDIRFQALRFVQLQDRVSLAKKASDISERRFEVAKNRYLIGKIDITNLQIAQNEKDSARQSYFTTLKQFWVAYFSLRRSTLYDFVDAAPLVVPDLGK